MIFLFTNATSVIINNKEVQSIKRVSDNAVLYEKQGAPLEITTIITNTFSSNGTSPFIFTGSLNINWGDGTSETYTGTAQLTHTYARYKIYTIQIEGNITEIKSTFIRNTSKITTITIPNTVTAFGPNCFQGCDGLTSINIPTGVTNIPRYCFNSCSSLTEITIPSNVTALSTYAFSNCTGLEKIRFERTTPPSAVRNVFRNLPTSCVIEVPSGSLSAYTSASNYPSSSTYTYVEY